MSKPTKSASNKELLQKLNDSYNKVHEQYEKYFWISYMGDHSVNDKYEKAQLQREKFRTDEKKYQAVTTALETARGQEKKYLEQWARFFSVYQTPAEVKPLYEKIVTLEKEILEKHGTRKEGYIHPKTKKFTKASRAQMRELIATHDDEKVRKACFKALEELSKGSVTEFVELVGLRNQYAHALGYEDFYAYKLAVEEQMTKKEVFSIFDAIYTKTKYAFKELDKLEKKLPGVKKPWNKAYLLAGDFTKESDQYFPLEEALLRWGRSFAALGITFTGGALKLDLLERKGKYDNGFCHWPKLVKYEDGKRIPGQSNFTCNAVYGQVGSAEEAYNTLFHEGGHAAHILNSTQTQACVNHEYPPTSTAWAETQSMFLDSMLSSIEWTSRYAKNSDGIGYPFDLFEREVRKLGPLSPLAMNSINMVMQFEREVYETEKLTEKKVLQLARKNYLHYTNSSEPALWLLQVPHIYSWESSCSYQGYGLAQIAVSQWREYFYKKYGYIVDNKQVGRELTKMWKYGASLSFPECVKLATGKKLTPTALIKAITAPVEKKLSVAKKRIAHLETVKRYTKPVDLGANITMVHGKETITSNKKSFETMCEKYAAWLSGQRVKTKH